MASAAKTLSLSRRWAGRVQLAAAVLIAWGALHFVAGLAFPPGLDRPLVLSASPYGPLAGLPTVAILWVAAALASALTGGEDVRRPLIVIGLALAIWAAEGGRQGGTMDDWLILQNEVPGPPTGRPYSRLLADYVYLFLGLAGAYAISLWLAGRLGQGPPMKDSLRRAFAAGVSGQQGRRGPLALLIATVVAGGATLLLMGPTSAATYRGQVYFAVGVGSFAGMFAGRQLTKVGDPLWYCPVPLLLGIIGLLVAAADPTLTLPAEYRRLNIIPAWGLARALPVEMVGVGLVGTLWMLRPPASNEGPAEQN